MKSIEYTVRAQGIEKDIRDYITAQLSNNSIPIKRNLNVRIGESMTVEIRFDYNKKPYASPCFSSVA